MSNIENNTIGLEEILAMVNELPNANDNKESVNKSVSSVSQLSALGLNDTFTGTITITSYEDSEYNNMITLKSGSTFIFGELSVMGYGIELYFENGYLTGYYNTEYEESETYENSTYLLSSLVISSSYNGETTGTMDLMAVGEIEASAPEVSDNSANEIIERTISGTYTNSKVLNIGSFAFYSCTRLTSINFPACTSIGTSAFYNCASLTSVSFPSCTIIGSSAFTSCNNLTSVSFPSCTIINTNAFNSCRGLTNVNFPVCTIINTNVFIRCSNLISVNFPSCSIISTNAFTSCNKLTSVSFPFCTIIGDYAFRFCNGLKNISFPVCTSIGAQAFVNCSGLTNISFPVCIRIGNLAFTGCSSLSKIYLGASTICSLYASTVFSNTSIWSNKGSIYVPSSLVASYKAATNWAFFSARIYSYAF